MVNRFSVFVSTSHDSRVSLTGLRLIRSVKLKTVFTLVALLLLARNGAAADLKKEARVTPQREMQT